MASNTDPAATGHELTLGDIASAIDRHGRERVPLLDRLWGYYRNPERALPTGGLRPLAGGAWDALSTGPAAPRLAQAAGLPERLRVAGREVVIENDIAWRLHAMVDLLFGRSVRVSLPDTGSGARPGAEAGAESAAELGDGSGLGELIERLIDQVWEASGGLLLMQDAALLGHIYGHVDLVLRVDEPRLRELVDSAGLTGGGGLVEPVEAAWLGLIAACFTIEVVEPRRGVAIDDGRGGLGAYVIHTPARPAGVAAGRGWWQKITGATLRTTALPGGQIEVFEPGRRRVFEAGAVVLDERSDLLGDRLAVTRMHNLAQPLTPEGLSEVEPLIPLQDELNTRLSDRAARVTLQSFKMYLAKGLDGFDRVPVGPGQVWSTDNPEASVESFGGDAASPSEDRHIAEVREAMDKISGVPPLAGGVVQGKIGNLSSGTALRITLLAAVQKTLRKRATYGRGIVAISGLVLRALAAAGVRGLEGASARVRLHWPETLPIDEAETVATARAKVDLGVPRSIVLAELGYGERDPGVQ